MADLVQQPYNLFAQQKQSGYPNVTTPKVETGQNTDFNLERDHQGNYYVNGEKTPMKVLNPDVVPYINENQRQGKPITSTEELVSAIGYTTPEQEEKMRKASVMNQRISAVGDAIRHIGNIANTVNYAPAQQLNNPVLEEQARYEKSKALRDRANQIYLNYQQKKEMQDAQARRWEAEREYKNQMLDHYRDQDRRLWEQHEENARRNAFLENLKKEEFDLKKAYNEGRISIAEYNARTSRIRALRAGVRGGGGTEWTRTSNTEIHRDENGRETGRTTTIQRSNGKTGEQSTAVKTSKKGDTNPYGGRKHGSGGKGKGNSGNKENKFGVRPAK